MPSLKPKIQGVIEPHLYEKYLEWKASIQARSDGAALNQLFSQFFNEPIEVITPDNSEITSLKEKVNHLGLEISQLKESQQDSINYHIDNKDKEHEQIKEMLADLSHRVTELENRLSPSYNLEIPNVIDNSDKLIEEIPSDNEVITLSLSGLDLGKRLGVTETAIRYHRKKGDLAEWSRKKDPEGKVWEWKKDHYEGK